MNPIISNPGATRENTTNRDKNIPVCQNVLYINTEHIRGGGIV